MRNPFKRRTRLPGASTDWDESEHLDLGDNVAIPVDQLPADYEGRQFTAEAMERLAGVSIYDMEGEDCVMVNVTLAEEAATDLAMEHAADPRHPTEEEMREATVAAFDDPNHWVHGDNIADDDTKYGFFPINTETGHLHAAE